MTRLPVIGDCYGKVFFSIISLVSFISVGVSSDAIGTFPHV